MLSTLMPIYLILELLMSGTFILDQFTVILLAITTFLFQGIALFQNKKMQNIFSFFATNNQKFDHKPVIVSWELSYFMAFLIILSCAGILFISNQYIVLFSILSWISWWAYCISRVYYQDYLNMTKQFFLGFMNNVMGGKNGKTGNSDSN
ncbi:MAG TPA: hypothetical protein P5277_05055 [Candidatus Paceibacterota bacterium]|nr:hypothetical protein [Candidatus Paceibacterota bacterium]